MNMAATGPVHRPGAGPSKARARRSEFSGAGRDPHDPGAHYASRAAKDRKTRNPMSGSSKLGCCPRQRGLSLTSVASGGAAQLRPWRRSGQEQDVIAVAASAPQ